MMQQPNLPLDGTFPATCSACEETIQVKVAAVHIGNDFSSGVQVRHANLRGEYQHDCPGPKGQA